jgi:putative ABC transport system substrate-binding protein
MLSALREGLRERGYLEGQNLAIDVRWPKEALEQISDVAAELVRSGVDIIVAWASPSVFAARRATATIPIVMVGVGDPVGLGFVSGLARPGGNVTGVSTVSLDLSGKLLELLIEIVPGMKRVGVVRNPNNPALATILRETTEAVRALGMQIEVVDAVAAEDFERAFTYLSAQGVRGVVLLPDPSIVEHRARIAELAQKMRLATAFQRQENVDAGGLLSYGPNLNEQLRHAAVYVDRILKGTRPAELPVEQPTKFALAINIKTAKALGLDVSPSLLARADDVVE